MFLFTIIFYVHVLFLLITALEGEEGFENDNQVARFETQISGTVDTALLMITLLHHPSVSRLLCNLTPSEVNNFFEKFL